MAGERRIVTAIFSQEGGIMTVHKIRPREIKMHAVYEWIGNEYEIGYFRDDFEMTLNKLY